MSIETRVVLAWRISAVLSIVGCFVVLGLVALGLERWGALVLGLDIIALGTLRASSAMADRLGIDVL